MVPQPCHSWAGSIRTRSTGRCILSFKHFKKPDSICDFADANMKHLLTSMKLIWACWVPLGAGYGYHISTDMLQLRLSKACHLWGIFGTAGVFILHHQVLHLPVPRQSTNAQSAGTKEDESFFTLRDVASFWLARAMTDKGAGGRMEQDRWQGGGGEGHGQRFIEYFKLQSFLCFYQGILACLSFRLWPVSRAVAIKYG